jgi:hypothetical protein
MYIGRRALSPARACGRKTFFKRHTLWNYLLKIGLPPEKVVRTNRDKKSNWIRWGEKNAAQIFPDARTNEVIFFLANLLFAFAITQRFCRPAESLA